MTHEHFSLSYVNFSSVVTYFVFVFHVVTFTYLAILLMPIDQLYFQISNCNVFVYVTLAYVFQISIVTVTIKKIVTSLTTGSAGVGCFVWDYVVWH